MSLALVLATLVMAQGHATSEKDVYPAPEVAPAQLKAALVQAAKTHKRVILDFGGNWCADCRVLDKYFHDPANAKLLKQGFILVDINVGMCDKNKDIAAKYGVPLEKGVPALAVLDPDGTLLLSQKQGEFESMRTRTSADLTEFLKRWTP